MYSEENMQFFGQLADLKNVQIIATIDGIRFSKGMLSREVFNQFSFCYYELPTLLPYTDTLDYLDFFLIANQRQKQSENYKGIFESFTESQKQLVFFILKQLYKNDFKPQEE